MKKEKIQAVFDEDLIHVLRKMNQLEKIEKGEIFCNECSSLITLENIQIVVPFFQKEYTYVCNNPDCVERYYANERK